MTPPPSCPTSPEDNLAARPKFQYLFVLFALTVTLPSLDLADGGGILFASDLSLRSAAHLYFALLPAVALLDYLAIKFVWNRPQPDTRQFELMLAFGCWFSQGGLVLGSGGALVDRAMVESGKATFARFLVNVIIFVLVALIWAGGIFVIMYLDHAETERKKAALGGFGERERLVEDGHTTV